MTRSKDEDDKAKRRREPAPSGEPVEAVAADRAAVVPEDVPKYRAFQEVHVDFDNFVYVRALQRIGGDVSGAEDASQDFWLRMHQRIENDGGVVPEPLMPAIYGIIDDVVRNHLRSRRRLRIDGEPDENAPASSTQTPERRVARAKEQAAAQEEVQYVLSRMDPYSAQVLQLDHVEGMPLKAIAVVVGRSVSTVSKDVWRARQKFREILLRLRATRGEK
jgi:RNA polymerase sigma factor (sigma-70 family)